MDRTKQSFLCTVPLFALILTEPEPLEMLHNGRGSREVVRLPVCLWPKPAQYADNVSWNSQILDFTNTCSAALVC